jgi:hypothetical protein
MPATTAHDAYEDQQRFCGHKQKASMDAVKIVLGFDK